MYRALASVAAIAAAALALAAFVPLLAPALPQCTDCAFTVRDAYVVQKADRGYIYAGGSSAAYGWIYLDGRPLKANEAAQCRWLNALVRGGIAYVSCSDVPRPVEWTSGQGGPGGVKTWRIYGRVFQGNSTQDLRGSVHLKIIDLRPLWEMGYDKAVVYVNPARQPAFVVDNEWDLLLAWEDCLRCDPPGGLDPYMYVDEVWLVSLRDEAVIKRVRSGGFWHEVRANGVLIWTWNKPGPKIEMYRSQDRLKVEFKSPDPAAYASAEFRRE